MALMQSLVRLLSFTKVDVCVWGTNIHAKCAPEIEATEYSLQYNNNLVIYEFNY